MNVRVIYSNGETTITAFDPYYKGLQSAVFQTTPENLIIEYAKNISDRKYSMILATARGPVGIILLATPSSSTRL